MDSNKLLKLIDVGYHLAKCCANCRESNFPSIGSMFGTCDKFKYFHQKHRENRQMSIHRLGVCREFWRKPLAGLDLEFFKYIGEK